MELPATGYLLSLAALSMAFTGFASLASIFLRPAKGGRLTSYDSFFTLSFVQLGFVIILGSLLPPMLALYGLDEPAIWRWSSGLTALPFGLFCIAAPLRRRRAGEIPGRTFFRVVGGLQLLALGALVLEAAGVRLGPGSAVYASNMTWIFGTSCLGYLLGLRVLLNAAPRRTRRTDA